MGCGPRTAARPSVRSAAVTGRSGHLACPFCNSYDVSRLYVASIAMDSCECLSCGARWDEDMKSGEYRGRGSRASVLAKRTGRDGT
jgi:transcription elongation factor Elf1